MTIESINSKRPPPPSLTTAPKPELDSGKKASINSVESHDSIAITAIAKEIKKAFELSSSIAVVDAVRVAAVKKALADGSYQINAEKIAEKMIQYEKLMPQGKGT